MLNIFPGNFKPLITNCVPFFCSTISPKIPEEEKEEGGILGMEISQQSIIHYF